MAFVPEPQVLRARKIGRGQLLLLHLGWKH
jgi:hypothetical protein